MSNEEEKIELADVTNFARINGKFYRTTPVNVESIEEVLEDIQRTADARLNQATRTLQVEVANAVNRIDSDEIQRITQRAQQNEVTVPSNRYGLPLVVIRGRLCPLRSILFSPNIVSGTVMGWRQHIRTTEVWRRIDELAGCDVRAIAEASGNASGHQIVLRAKTRLSKVIGCSIVNGGIVTSGRNFHTLGTEVTSADMQIIWYRMCTGATAGEDYWAQSLAEFTKSINKINLDSIGSGTADVSVGSISLINYIIAMLDSEDKELRFLRPEERW